MKVFCFISLIACCFVTPAFAQQRAEEQSANPYDPRSTLNYYVQRADCVVVGTLRTPVDGGFGGGPIPTPGHPVLSPLSVIADFEIQQVLKGGPLPEKHFLVDLCILYCSTASEARASGQSAVDSGASSTSEEPAPLKYQKGDKFILFLRPTPSSETMAVNSERVLFRTVDPWFGILPFSETLALGLRQIIGTP